MVEKPAGLIGVLKLDRLGARAAYGGEDALGEGAIPAGGEVGGEGVERGVGAGVVDLGADAADVVVGRGEDLVGDEGAHVGDEAAAVVAEQRAVF